MTLFSDFLTALRVKHTTEYSDTRYNQMPFQSMFGLSSLLKEYGVGAVGVNVDKDARAQALASFHTPFLASTADGFLIVTSVKNGTVDYMSQHRPFTVPTEEVLSAWNGIALLAQADDSSIEPAYISHHIGELAEGVKKYALYALLAILFGYGMWQSGLYAHWGAWCVAAFDIAGIWFSWMLVQKSLGMHNGAADAVCSAIEEGGCDEIATSEASSFMGIFKWSEVGLTYFSISIMAMLLFPALMPSLAAVNILCLPYTVWSITYQKFKAKVWCTLCVCVQATLWLLFASYLLGGWTKEISLADGAFWIHTIALGCVYAATLLGINRLDTFILKHISTNTNDNSSST